MHPSIVPLAAIFRLNTQLLLNCLDGLTDALATERGPRRLNSVAFLTAHLTDTRHYLAGLVGQPLPTPFSPAIAKARSLDEAGPLPPLATLIGYWEAISAHLAVVIERLDTPQLAAPTTPLPESDGSVLGALAFLAQHESYHLGQIALLRRGVGLPAMRYDLPAREPGRRGA
jgi:uncharacterized damage-inducible protein DinB